MQLKVITIGNAVIDTFLTLSDSQADCSLDKEHNRLSVPYGKKILLDGCTFVLGGNACNVAVGMSRLGLRSALLAEIGSDEFAQKIMNGLRKENVATDLLIRGDGQSSLAIGINFQGERTLFIEHTEREHDFSLHSLQADYFYLTSLGTKWEHVYKRVEEKLLVDKSIKLAFNPGSVQIKKGLTSFEYLLPHTNILFLNKDEAQQLLSSVEEMPELLKAFSAKGVECVVLTDGENGSCCIDKNGIISTQEIIPCSVVERTGAGDAFATGFLAAIMSGKDMQNALKMGARNSAAVIEKVGSQEGLLREKELVL